MRCKCGSYAINKYSHGRDGSDDDMCDVCYWRKRAEQRDELLTICKNVVERGIGTSDVKAMKASIARVKGTK